tara:strand:+ start:34366 stop:35364 length:999 start_codon:yes stop_codon:yes gene_type:complete
MAKFINKKEQVFDLKLTSYGHYLLSVGQFKPTYYAFYDDNVLYDGSYAGMFERQNEIQNRIKNETQYLEGLVLFQNIENVVVDEDASEVNFYSWDVTPLQTTPRKDIFKFDAAIGDAYLDGETQKAPAWKMVTLQGAIESSQPSDETNETLIPQINISSRYKKKIRDYSLSYNPADVRDLRSQTGRFVDNNSIELIPDDPLVYLEEANTQLLTENFDIEVFEVLTGSTETGEAVYQLQRKFFRRETPQISNGFLRTETQTIVSEADINTGSVEYYFDILLDQDIDREVACRGALEFNKESYYVDLDFDCEETDNEELFYDIYGSTTEPEICQ